MPKQTFLNLPEEKRARIIEAAAQEFAANGLENASTNRIVANSGIAKGSFYQYFEDKRDVFLYLMRVLEEEKLAFFSHRHPPSERMDTFSYFRWMIQTGMEFDSAYPHLAQAMSRVLFTEGLYYGPLFADLRQRGRAALTAMVEKAREAGELGPNVEVEMAVMVMETWSNVITNLLIEPLRQQADAMAWVRSPEVQNKIDQLFYVMEYGLRNTSAPAERTTA